MPPVAIRYSAGWIPNGGNATFAGNHWVAQREPDGQCVERLDRLELATVVATGRDDARKSVLGLHRGGFRSVGDALSTDVGWAWAVIPAMIVVGVAGRGLGVGPTSAGPHSLCRPQMPIPTSANTAPTVTASRT